MAGTNNSIQDRVYYTLRTYILDFRLVPGTIMSTQEMADSLQISRTPVREAFIRLQRDGLVQILPQRETMVSLIDMNRVRQERFLRMNIEPAVIRAFLLRRNPEHMERLRVLLKSQRAACAAADHEALHKYDNEFHQVFYEGASQPLVWDMISQSSTHYQRVRLLSLRHQDIPDDIILQHQKLFDALETGDLEEALRLNRQHLGQLDAEEDILRKKNPEYFLDETPGKLTLL